jgi:hypothetical protein
MSTSYNIEQNERTEANDEYNFIIFVNTDR